MKPLDRDALSLCTNLRSNKFKIRQIINELIKLGYTKKLGGNLCSATVSHFMCDNGLRTYPYRKIKHYKKASYKTSKSVSVVETKNDIKILTNLVFETKELSNDQKISILKIIG